MKILLVEDEERNIRSALEQLGEKHELTIIRSLSEFNEWAQNVKRSESEKPDFILTDCWIPLGTFPEGLSIKKLSAPSELHPIGPEVLLFALIRDIPCGMVTDDNSHDSVIGYTLDLVNIQGGKGYIAQTRPDFTKGGGKDWLYFLTASHFRWSDLFTQ